MGAEAALGLIYTPVRRPSDLTRLGGTTHIECSAVRCYLTDDPSTAEARVRSNRHA